MHGKIWKIQYEGLKMICFTCGRAGYRGKACSCAMENEVAQKQGNNDGSHPNDRTNPIDPGIAHPEKSTDYGSWMQVKRPTARRRPSKQQEPKQANTDVANKEKEGANQQNSKKFEAGGSRFQILEENNFDGRKS